MVIRILIFSIFIISNCFSKDLPDDDFIVRFISQSLKSTSKDKDKKKQDLIKLLKRFNIYDDINSKYRDRVLSKLALNLPPFEQRSSNNNNYIRTNRLTILEEVIKESGYSLPSNMYQAKELEEAAIRYKDDYPKYLDYVEANFQGEVINKITEASMSDFNYEKTSDVYARQLINLSYGEVNQNFLMMVIQDQIEAQSSLAQGQEGPLFIPGLLEEALLYYDLDHTQSSFGSVMPSLLCQFAEKIHDQIPSVRDNAITNGYELEDNTENSEIDLIGQILIIDTLLQIGSNPNLKCTSGLTSLDILKKANEEKLLDISFFNLPGTGVPCHGRRPLEIELPGLCLNASVVWDLTKQLSKADRHLEKSNQLNHTNIYGTTVESGCSLVLISHYISQTKEKIQSSYKLDLSLNGSEMKIQAFDREKFVKTLRRLAKLDENQ